MTLVITLALAIIQSVPKLAGRKNITEIIMVTPTAIVGVFLFLGYRFPASTWNTERGFVHVLYPYGSTCRNHFVCGSTH